MPVYHSWVQHTVTPVSLLPNTEAGDTEGFTVIPSESEAVSVIGCQLCSVPLTTSTVNSLCTSLGAVQPTP